VCVGTASIFDGKRVIAFKAAGYRFRSLGCWNGRGFLLGSYRLSNDPVRLCDAVLSELGHEHRASTGAPSCCWRFIAIPQTRSSALVFLRHAQECSSDLWCSHRSSVVRADAGQFYKIVFHAFGSALVLCHPGG
jgi:hypothetical protein